MQPCYQGCSATAAAASGLAPATPATVGCDAGAAAHTAAGKLPTQLGPGRLPAVAAEQVREAVRAGAGAEPGRTGMYVGKPWVCGATSEGRGLRNNPGRVPGKFQGVAGRRGYGLTEVAQLGESRPIRYLDCGFC